MDSRTDEQYRAAILQAIADGRAPHYCFIFDRSDSSKNVFETAKAKLPEINDRAQSPAFATWDQTGFPYVLVWGTWNFTGGLTIPCADLDALLAEGLPTTVKRTVDQGGLCNYILAVDPSVAPRIEACIAELQPTSGPSGPAQ